MDKEKLRERLFLLVLVILFLPLLNGFLVFTKEPSLAGVYPKAASVALTQENWHNRAFQKNAELYFNLNFGYRNTLMRLRYQWMYSAYGTSRLYAFLKGKNDYLFQSTYTAEDLGESYVGDEIIDTMFQKMIFINREMKKMNKAFVVMIAPSKTHYHPEHLPEQYIPTPDVKTNYKAYTNGLKKHNIAHLNLNDLFIAMKDTTTYPLFPKTGIHWSTYGAAILADTIVNYWEGIFNRDMAEVYWDSITVTRELRDDDWDIEWTMNLMYYLPNIPMAYPHVKINDKNKFKPKILTIGDSFFWRYYHWKMMHKIYDNSQFWYYNREVYPGRKPVGQFDLMNMFPSLDGICIFINPSQMNRFSWGLVDDLYNYLDSGTPEEIEAMKQKMLNNPDWLAQQKEKAAKRGIPLDSLLEKDAIYMLRIEKAKQQYIRKHPNGVNREMRKEIRAMKTHILNTPDWLEAIKERAKDRNIPLDSMVYIEAKFMVVQQQKKKVGN